MESVKTGDEIRSCSRSSRTTSYRLLCFVRKALFSLDCLTYKSIQRFRNGPVHNFHGLKDSQMSKVHASSHEYPHVEKFKNLLEQNFEGEANNKQLDSEDTQRSDFSN